MLNRADASVAKSINKDNANHISSSKSTGGLAVLCSNCSSAVANSSHHHHHPTTPPKAIGQTGSCQVTQVSPIYNSPFYTFAATSPVQSSDPVPPRILQILGFAQGMY